MWIFFTVNYRPFYGDQMQKGKHVEESCFGVTDWEAYGRKLS
jgi:hypothetical protein